MMASASEDLMDDEKPDDEQVLVKHAARMVKSCKAYLDEQSDERRAAFDYYAGDMTEEMPASAGRSSVVSKDVRAIIKKVMPSLTRTILSNDKIVEYAPVGPEDEEGSEQATDYINHVVIPECGAEDAIYDAIHDACLVKTGILKWSAYTYRKAVVQDYTDQPDDAVVGLFDDPDNEVIDYETSEETDPGVLQLDPNARRHTFKLKRIVDDVQIKLEAVPRGSFLISPGADDIETADLVGEELQPTRSELVSMGYDKDKVWRLKSISESYDEDADARMGDDYTSERSETQKALDEVLVYEVYAKIDSDGDGIAEVHRIVYGDEGDEHKAHIILAHEQVTEAPYADVVIERDAHQFEGHSVYEDTRDVQRVKTALIRQTLDNLYAQNNPRPVVDLDAVEDERTVMSPKSPAEPIVLRSGRKANEVINWQVVPFVGDKSFQMLDYWDEIAKERTGITDASGGVDPEAFQNTSATAAHLMSESGIAQADAIVRSVSRGGLRKAFRGLLKLVIAHSDGPRTVRMKQEWVSYDPRVWNADMDCSINVGLGGGSKERDMATLQIVLGLQRELIASFGPDNPYVTPEQLYNTLAKITETAGFPSADPFFTQPDPEQIKQRLAAEAQKPSEAQEKIQAQMQIEKMKQQTNRDKEMAQLEADLQVKQAEIQARTQENREKLALQREQDEQAERLALAKMENDRWIATQKLQADVQKAQAASIPSEWGNGNE